ncbi:ribose-phosphate pyrophosphokinase [bacterium]|nr:MAG: ribose-phosphate pyrophosphokinase [bacterium]RIK63056.1 MAG: phosphoribosylpyrophosphate synthetase [Planctomycetota bacterium]
MNLLLAWPGNETLAQKLGHFLSVPVESPVTRRFPDGETYLRLGDVRGRDVAIVASLDRPDDKTLPLLLLADALRAEGAAGVGLVAPYLAYLRQDRQFLSGEAVTSRTFARLLSGAFQWLVTVDPHLHRYHSLGEIYSIDTAVVHAAPEIAAWIKSNVERPLVIGPDSESEQWVREIAGAIGAPYATLEKTRRGDRDVEVSIPHIEQWPGHTPVLADDIVSTGRTMVAAIGRLAELKQPAPVCVGVHAIFAQDAWQALVAAGPARIATCNTIAHPTNAIDLTAALAAGIRKLV